MMSKNRPLYGYIGDGVLVLSGSSYGSAGTAASDNAGGVPVAGADGVLFALLYGATDANAAFTVQLQYSSTGNASDAVTSNAGMTCTDAIYTTSIHVTANQCHLLDYSVSAKGMADAAGKLYASIAAAETGDAKIALVGFPYGGTRIYPATNANAVIVADD